MRPRFTFTSLDEVGIINARSTGTFVLTAANGGQLRATTAGGQEAFEPPNIAHIRLEATITGGTGQFAGASGQFVITFRGEIDFRVRRVDRGRVVRGAAESRAITGAGRVGVRP